MTARLIAVVVLPSPGSELVITTSLLSLSTWTYCMLVRSTRNASAHGVGVSSTSAGARPTAPVSEKMLPTIGASVTSPMSSAELTEVSSRSRTTAAAMPRSRPSSAARARLRTGCGETGEVGIWASSTIEALIGAFSGP